MTLKMTTVQVVETSVTVTNSSFQNYTHPDDHTTRTSFKEGIKHIYEASQSKEHSITKGAKKRIMDADWGVFL